MGKKSADQIEEYLRQYVQQSLEADESDRDYSTAEEARAWPRHLRPGRPNPYNSKSPRTLHSYLAAFFLISEMIRYRSRKNVKRVPGPVRTALLRTAMTLYPEADESLIIDHVRMRKKHFDMSLLEDFDFPTD